MMKNYLFLAAILIYSFNHSTGQYCTAVGPSSVIDSNLQSFNLSGESATEINYIGCPGLIGLDDQTGMQSVVLNAGASYTANAGFGSCGGSYAGVGEAWIDYNQNQLFEPSESIGTWSGTPPTAVSVWGFTVPVGAISGTTRMRVVLYEGGALPINPCASFTWGSTTDFTVQIGGGMDCSSYVGESLADPRLVTSLPYTENYNNTICYLNVLTVYPSPDVFYRIIPAQLGGAQYLTVSLCNSTFDTYLSILNKTGEVLWYNDDHLDCGTSSKITFAVGLHDTLYAAVQGWGTQAGDYTIEINQEFSGIEKKSLSQISVFPNPANSNISILSDEDGQADFFDISGKLRQSNPFYGTEPIDITGLTTGTYLLRITTISSQTTQKIIIE